MHLKGADSMAVSGLSVWNALFGSKCADSMAVSGLSFEMPWMDHCCPLMHKWFKKTVVSPCTAPFPVLMDILIL